MGVTVNVVGVDKLISDLQKTGIESQRMVTAILGTTAANITNEQKLAAPSDLGTIRQNLGNRKVSEVLYEIFSNAPESPYQEFGTGPQVNVGNHADEAAEFQGKGTGDWQEFIKALTDWVRRHGGGYGSSYSVKTRKRSGTRSAQNSVDEQAAWAIAKAILQRGLRPQPFFYYNVDEGFAKLEPMLQTALNEVMNKSI